MHTDTLPHTIGASIVASLQLTSVQLVHWLFGANDGPAYLHKNDPCYLSEHSISHIKICSREAIISHSEICLKLHDQFYGSPGYEYECFKIKTSYTPFTDLLPQ